MEIYLISAAQGHNSYDWIEEENRRIDEKMRRARAKAGWCIAEVQILASALSDRLGWGNSSVSAH